MIRGQVVQLGSISALLRSLSCIHRSCNSWPTTLSTSSESMSFDSLSFFALRLTQSTLGQATFSRVPSSIARDQHELRHGVQLWVVSDNYSNMRHSQDATTRWHFSTGFALSILHANSTRECRNLKLRVLLFGVERLE